MREATKEQSNTVEDTKDCKNNSDCKRGKANQLIDPLNQTQRRSINWLKKKKHNDVQKCPEQERRSEQIPMKQNACMATVEATPPLQPENSGL